MVFGYLVFKSIETITVGWFQIGAKLPKRNIVCKYCMGSYIACLVVLDEFAIMDLSFNLTQVGRITIFLFGRGGGAPCCCFRFLPHDIDREPAATGRMLPIGRSCGESDCPLLVCMPIGTFASLREHAKWQ